MKRWIGVWLALSFLLPAMALSQGRPDIRWISGGHEGVVSRIAYSPDGKTLASIGTDHTIKLWNRTTRILIRTLLLNYPLGKGHTSAIAFSPDGKTLASGVDNDVLFWRVSDGTQTRKFSGHTLLVTALLYASDGKVLFSGSADKSIRFWRVADGTVLQTLLPQSAVESMALSPDGALLAAGCTDKAIHVWKVSDGTPRFTLQGHTGAVNGVAFSPDGKTLASCGGYDQTTLRYDNTVRLWRTADGKALYSVPSQNKIVFSLAFTPDGKTLLSGGGEYDTVAETGSIELWRASDGHALDTFTGLDGPVSTLNISADGAILTSGAYDGTIRFWHLPDGSALGTLTGQSSSIASVQFSPDGRWLASCCNGQITLWNAGSGQLVRTIGKRFDFTGNATFAPDGKSVAVENAGDDTIKLWDVATGKLIRTFASGGTEGDAYSVAFSPDGKLLASGGYAFTDISNKVNVWRVSDGTLLTTLLGNSSDFTNVVAFTPDSHLLATTYGNSVQLWRVSDWSLLTTLTGFKDETLSLDISPNGRELAAGSGVNDPTIRLWQLPSGSLAKTLAGHAGSVFAVAFSRDSRVVLSGAVDFKLKLWRAASGSLLTYYDQETGNAVNTVAFSPEGSLFAYGRRDATLVVARYPYFVMPTLSAVHLNTDRVKGGATPFPLATITLSNVAPFDGASIAVTSSDPGTATVPSPVVVPANQTVVTFPVTTKAVTSTRVVTLRVQLGKVSQTIQLTVTP